METGTASQKLMAAGLSALLVSCSAAHFAPPTAASAAIPFNSLLIIEESQDGQLTHSWQPADNFTLSSYRLQTGNGGEARRIVPAAARSRDCDEENRECYSECMARPLPRGYGSFTSPRKSGGKSEFCRGECQRAYDDCVELERLRPREFTAVDGAIDWLKRHRTAVLIGSIIVIAGVAFVVVSVGVGVVILAPMVLTASTETPSGIPVAEGPR
ncbi:hypothetical protein MEBOL_005229 [Melittangium boletus DSM 14713]|uniref:Lipoprotein n=1 Tax=Melittangium boletus DSM 14713 TaxID=1294270 RepID=A0A250IKM5_9BACT|nr:hypothetical protein MEBOL_005229 [Melittangium boletus DSM 14713]